MHVTSSMLKADADEILQRLEEDREPVEITRDAQVIARLVPVPDRSPSDKRASTPPSRRDGQAANLISEEERHLTVHVLDELDRLADEIGLKWPGDVSAVAAVRDVRRDL